MKNIKLFEELNEIVDKDKKNRYFSSYGDAEKLGEQICDFIDRKRFVFKDNDNFDFYTELNKLLYKHILKKHTTTSNEPHEDYREVLKNK